MSKFGQYHDYPARGIDDAIAALLTVWPSLCRYHEDLVLVGGLAVHCLTKQSAGGYPRAVTMDADFGISMAAGGDLYGTIASDLSGLGFRQDPDTPNRLFRLVNGTKLYIDFLTEDPNATTGTRMVDDVVASVVPGIRRALECRRRVSVAGEDLFGVEQDIKVYIADIGPLLVLKINAFGGPTGRRHPKDAYDVLLAVLEFVDGPDAAIGLFQKEGECGTSAYDSAIRSLKQDFCETTGDGAIRAAEFLRGTLDESERIRQDVVTVARALLGEG